MSTDWDVQQKRASTLKLYSEIIKNISVVSLIPIIIGIFYFHWDDIKKFSFMNGLVEVEKADSLYKGRSEDPSAIAVFKEDIKSAAQISEQKIYWVYLGESAQGDSSNTLITRFFNINSVPNPQTKITSITPVSKRASTPKEIGNQWILGGLLGLLEEQKSVAVIETSSISGTEHRLFWWAKVQD